jgi:Zn-dependent protease with chaperone function
MALLLVTFAMAWVMARGAVRRSRRPGVSPEQALLEIRRSGAAVAGMSLVLGLCAFGEFLLEVPPLQQSWWAVCTVVTLVARLVAAIVWLDQVLEPIAAHRDLVVDRDRAFSVGLRTVLVRLVPQHLLLACVAWLSSRGEPMPVIGAAVLGYVLLCVAFAPWILRLSVRVRPASPVEQARVDLLSERYDLRVGLVRVVEPGPLGATNGFVIGIGPSGSRVHLTERLLAGFDDDDLSAVLAHEVGHRELHHLATRLGASLAVSVAALTLMCVLTVDHADGLALLALSVLVALVPVLRLRLVGGLAVRQELAADAYAAARVGPLAMRRALERLFADNRLPAEVSHRRARKQGHPSLRQRLDQLATMHDAKQNAPRG